MGEVKDPIHYDDLPGIDYRKHIQITDDQGQVIYDSDNHDLYVSMAKRRFIAALNGRD